MDRQLEKQLLGAAGVYFAAAELSKRGYIALTTSRNLKTYDLFAINPNTNKSLPLQVKSTQQIRTNPDYDMYIIKSDCNPRNLDEELKKINLTFIFVYFPSDKNLGHKYFIVPPDDLQALTKTAWKEYMDTSKHRKTIDELESVTHPMGPWIKHLAPFENRWDLIEKLTQ